MQANKNPVLYGFHAPVGISSSTLLYSGLAAVFLLVVGYCNVDKDHTGTKQ